jgi:hypothetical protein
MRRLLGVGIFDHSALYRLIYTTDFRTVILFLLPYHFECLPLFLKHCQAFFLTSTYGSLSSSPTSLSIFVPILETRRELNIFLGDQDSVQADVKV